MKTWNIFFGTNIYVWLDTCSLLTLRFGCQVLSCRRIVQGQGCLLNHHVPYMALHTFACLTAPNVQMVLVLISVSSSS